MLPLGAKVYHEGHGEGQVVGHNDVKINNYLQEKKDGLLILADCAGLLAIATPSFYTGDRYPNIVIFDSGYRDVYGDNELSLIN